MRKSMKQHVFIRKSQSAYSRVVFSAGNQTRTQDQGPTANDQKDTEARGYVTPLIRAIKRAIDHLTNGG